MALTPEGWVDGKQLYFLKYEASLDDLLDMEECREVGNSHRAAARHNIKATAQARKSNADN